MRKHHYEVIAKVKSLFTADPAYRGLLLTGSVARGWAQTDSDVDIILIVTDQEYARRLKQFDLHYFNGDICGYPGGYVDGKIVNLSFLQETARQGNEMARAAFSGSQIIFSRIPGLRHILQKITTYPKAGHRKKLENFYAFFEYNHWLLAESRKRQDRFVQLQAAVDMVYFGSRLVLARNRILFPSLKWLLPVLAKAADKPRRLLSLTRKVLADPSERNAEAYFGAVAGYQDWPKPSEGWPTRFMLEGEWIWRSGKVPVRDF